MKHIKYIFSFFLLALTLGCAEDDNLNFLDSAPAPSNISALFTITQDNSGLVTVRPNGDGMTAFRIGFGDGTTEEASVSSGQTVDHTYAEGTYTVVITGVGVTGLETSVTQQLTVSFVAPENLDVIVTPQTGNPFMINVTATADFETYFEVYFGEDPMETPQQFNEGQTISHTYAAIGTYEIRVVAFSGGAATSEATIPVTIFDPILMPVTFESPTLNYAFENFGGATSSVVNNPDISSGNGSAKVAKLNKAAGAETWAGSFLQLDEAIDFASMQKISVKTWSPAAGVTVRLKVENATDGGIFAETDAVTTVANSWETLTFDFTGLANPSNSYHKVVIFFDFGNWGSNADYYYDDIQLTSGDPQIVLPLNFEADLGYAFENFGGAHSQVVDNPQSNGINTSAKVGQFTKNAGAETWAGSFIALEQPIDFSAMHKIKLKTWSPVAGATVLVKLENLNDGSIFIERSGVTTVANQWEEITIDFEGVVNANQYQRFVIFFDFGVNGTGANYYFDDVQLTN